MTTFLAELRQTIVPEKHSKQGPLPPLLLALTLVTGLVDAFSYLILGHVFVANMTGNVVLLGFALAGAPGSRSLPPRRPSHRLASAPWSPVTPPHGSAAIEAGYSAPPPACKPSSSPPRSSWRR